MVSSGHLHRSLEHSGQRKRRAVGDTEPQAQGLEPSAPAGDDQAANVRRAGSLSIAGRVLGINERSWCSRCIPFVGQP